MATRPVRQVPSAVASRFTRHARGHIAQSASWLSATRARPASSPRACSRRYDGSARIRRTHHDRLEPPNAERRSGWMVGLPTDASGVESLRSLVVALAAPPGEVKRCPTGRCAASTHMSRGATGDAAGTYFLAGFSAGFSAGTMGARSLLHIETSIRQAFARFLRMNSTFPRSRCSVPSGNLNRKL